MQHDLYVRNLQREQVRIAIQQLPIEFRIVLVPRRGATAASRTPLCLL